MKALEQDSQISVKQNDDGVKKIILCSFHPLQKYPNQTKINPNTGIKDTENTITVHNKHGGQ